MPGDTMASKTRKRRAGSEGKRRGGRTKPTFIEEARRRQILDASMQLFARNGFDQTSLAEIADEVGVSKGVISYHFDGKRDLGEEVIRRSLREYGTYVQERIARKSTGSEKLLEFVNACLDFIAENADFYMVYFDVQGCFGTAEEKQSMLAFVNSRTRELLIGIIEQGKNEGNIRKRVSTRNLADVVQAMVDGIQSQIAAEPDSIDIAGCRRIFLDMIGSHIDA
jgi:AcrR family transcriptional regulator